MNNSEIAKIQDHFNKLYSEWERIIYPNGRKTKSAAIKVILGCKTSGFCISKDQIIIYISDGNIEDFEDRLGILDTHSGIWERPINETELLHEMLHEMQYKELLEASVEGKELWRINRTRFSGHGHGELFFSAVVEAAKCLGHDPESFVKDL